MRNEEWRTNTPAPLKVLHTPHLETLTLDTMHATGRVFMMLNNNKTSIGTIIDDIDVQNMITWLTYQQMWRDKRER